MELQEWQFLHMRSVRGELLTPDERLLLDAAYARLNAEEEEALRPAHEAAEKVLREAQAEIAALKAEIAIKRQQVRNYDSRIRRLENTIISSRHETSNSPTKT